MTEEILAIIILVLALVIIPGLGMWFALSFRMSYIKSIKQGKEQNVIKQNDVCLTGWWLADKNVNYNLFDIVKNSGGIVMPGLAVALASMSPVRFIHSILTVNNNEIKFFIGTPYKYPNNKNMRLPVVIKSENIEGIAYLNKNKKFEITILLKDESSFSFKLKAKKENVEVIKDIFKKYKYKESDIAI